MASTTSPRPATPGPGDTRAAAAPPAWERAARDFSAWRAGDPAALRRLVEALTPVLWHTARAYGLNREAADDVVQATWLALVRGADSLRDPQAVWRWVTVTARREAWRAARHDRRETTTDDQRLDAAAPPSAGPESIVLADAGAAALWRHVAALTARCRRLLRLQPSTTAPTTPASPPNSACPWAASARPAAAAWRNCASCSPTIPSGGRRDRSGAARGTDEWGGAS